MSKQTAGSIMSFLRALGASAYVSGTRGVLVHTVQPSGNGRWRSAWKPLRSLDEARAWAAA